MTEDKEQYKSIFKATSLFGGVQVISILASVIKIKIVAILLGTAGVGLISVYNAISQLFSSLSNLGIQTSAVRDISAANQEGNEEKLSERVSTTNTLAWWTSILGGIITIALAPVLSRAFFKTNDYSIQIIFLSLVVVFTGLYNQEYAILQGTRSLKKLAKSSICGVVTGVFVSLPLFYFLRQDGIVPALVISAFISMAISYYYAKKIKIKQYKQSLKQAFLSGIPVIKLGFFVALSNNVTYLVQFLLKGYISNCGGLNEVGLFQAGWAINAQYVGLVFTAMSKDYFPRLCQISNDSYRMRNSIQEQGEIGLLILAPMIAIMLLFIKLVINFLYSTEFYSVSSLVSFMLLGTMFQVISWGVGYVFLAKKDGRLYFFNEVGTKVMTFPLYVIGYYLCGLTGLGYAFISIQIIYLVWVSIVAFKRYRVYYSGSFYRLFITMMLPITLITCCGYIIPESTLCTIIKSILTFIVVVYSIIQLNKRINIMSLLKRK